MFANVDFGVSKTFKINERAAFRFDANFFDLLNHPNFLNPGALGTGGNNFASGTSSGNSAKPQAIPAVTASRSWRFGSISDDLRSAIWADLKGRPFLLRYCAVIFLGRTISCLVNPGAPSVLLA